MRKTLIILSILTLCASILLFADKKIIIKKSLNQTIDSLVVEKRNHLLNCYANKKLIKSYHCGIGENENGHKQKEGDNRTPEGKYNITGRNNQSKYYKNLHINYPNTKDIFSAKKRNVSPGGEIKIHGYADGFGNKQYRNIKFSTTKGCVGVTNADMDELYKWVKEGATIVIKP